jgi:hypothetical protein
MNVRQLFGRGVVAGGIGAMALTVGGLGIATAANGGSLVLGHHNTATKTTTLKDKHGTPLSLVGKKSKPPLKVNSSKQVAHLNASLVGGRSASQLATNGSAAQTSTGADVPITESSALVVQTASLKPGTYYVNASGLLTNTANGGFCFVASTSTSTPLQYGGVDATSTWVQASETVVVKVTTPTVYAEYCYTVTGSGEAYNAGISAIKVANSVAGTPASATKRSARHVAAPGR